jgi:hypothetical protein
MSNTILYYFFIFLHLRHVNLLVSVFQTLNKLEKETLIILFCRDVNLYGGCSGSKGFGKHPGRSLGTFRVRL